MLIVGIDEAGYGPTLGPMCHGLATFRVPGGSVNADLWTLLRPAVARVPAPPDAIEIDDSKRVYAGPRKLERLRRSVRAMTCCVPGASATLPDADLLSRLLSADDLMEFTCDPWWCELRPADTSVSAVGDDGVAGLKARLRASGCELLMLQVRAMDTRRFNAEVDRTGNKADVAWVQVGLLIKEAIGRAAEEECVRCVVDRQGGRKFYAGRVGELLDTVLVQVEEETAKRSAYRCEATDRSVRIEFIEKGEGESLPVALASMAAKYVREVLMRRFNAFFQQQDPSLRPTAGYPDDARRFLRETEALRQRLGVAEEALIRRK